MKPEMIPDTGDCHPSWRCRDDYTACLITGFIVVLERDPDV